MEKRKVEKLKLGIAIPTYNRLEKLKVLLNSIDKQIFSKNLDLSLFISNIASTDGTSEFLEEEVQKRYNLKVYNRPEDQTIKPNIFYLNKIISSDIEWVWFMGDDDKLSEKNSLQKVYECLKENNINDLEFFCACEKRRSRNTSKVFIDKVFNLCNKFGYHEMLGWISSIILKKQTFQKVFDDISQSITTQYQNFDDAITSAYPHSASILKYTHDKNGLFYDFGLVETQDKLQTIETQKRWVEENMLWRYFHVIDDIENLINQKILEPNSLNLTFFRYHAYFLWDHLIFLTFKRLPQYIRSRSDINDINNHIQILSNNLCRLLKAENFLKNVNDRKDLTLKVTMCINYLQVYVSNNFSEEIRTNLFDSLTNVIAIPNFPFQICLE